MKKYNKKTYEEFCKLVKNDFIADDVEPDLDVAYNIMRTDPALAEYLKTLAEDYLGRFVDDIS